MTHIFRGRKLSVKLINARWVARRATIITTNLDARALWEMLGKRLYSRLVGLTGQLVHMAGRDHRVRARPGARRKT
jgi:DNA replication protein DnaC